VVASVQHSVTRTCSFISEKGVVTRRHGDQASVRHAIAYLSEASMAAKEERHLITGQRPEADAV